jgi:hypothetical protein
LHALLRRHVLRRRLLIIGAGQRAWDLLLLIRREGTGRHDDVTLLHHPSLGEIDPRLLEQEREQIIRVENFNVAAVAREVNPDVVIVAPDERRVMEMHALLECKKSGYPVIPYLTFIEKEIHRIDLKRMELGWLVYSDGFTFGNMDRFLKRVFDVGGSAAALVLMAPLLLVAMIAIRLDGPGPVFQRQERVTQDSRVFLRIKLLFHVANWGCSYGEPASTGCRCCSIFYVATCRSSVRSRNTRRWWPNSRPSSRCIMNAIW